MAKLRFDGLLNALGPIQTLRLIISVVENLKLNFTSSVPNNALVEQSCPGGPVAADALEGVFHYTTRVPFDASDKSVEVIYIV